VHRFGIEFQGLLSMDSGPPLAPSTMKSNLTSITFHPIRPWVAAVEAKDVGIVWNYETKEVIKRFSLQVISISI
jgi:hypothetical protein